MGEFFTNRGDQEQFFLNKIDAWEIWNEPDLGAVTTGIDAKLLDPVDYRFTPQKYVNLLRPAYNKLHPLQEDVVLGGSASNKAFFDDDAEPYDALFAYRWEADHNRPYWLNHIYDPDQDGNPIDGVKNYFDKMGTHPYQGPIDLPPEYPDTNTNGDPEGLGDNIYLIDHVEVVRELMNHWYDADHTRPYAVDPRPIWFTEFGWSSHENDGAERGNHVCGVSAAQQANYLKRGLSYVRDNHAITDPSGVEAMFWYNERNTPYDAPDDPHWERHNENFGLLKGAVIEGVPYTPERKKSFFAMMKWVNLNNGSSMVGGTPADEEEELPLGIVLPPAPSVPDDTPTIDITPQGEVVVFARCRNNALFVVTMSGTSTNVVTVNYGTQPGTASGTPYGTGGRYQATSGQLVFNPGETRKIVAVPVLEDYECRPEDYPRDFFVKLSAPTGGASLGRELGRMEIVDCTLPADQLIGSQSGPPPRRW